MHQYNDEIPHAEKQKKHVILVNPDDTEIGSEDVIRAHTGSGKLHRAISVLIFRKTDDVWQMLLTRRSSEKLLWPGYFTNAVCTHPQQGESSVESAARRLAEELGIVISPKELHWVFALKYQAQYTPNLAENELDAVFVTMWDGSPDPNGHEVSEWKWEDWEVIKRDVTDMPKHFTPWFQIICGDRRIDTALEKLI